MTQIERQGRCLCGAVSFHLELDDHQVGACHCDMCRRWGGAPSMMVECATPPRFADDSHVRVYASSDWAERGFCDQCGSHLFYRLKDGGFYAVPVGLLEGADQPWTLVMEVFIDEKPAFYAFANDTRKLTGAELFAQHNDGGQDG